MLCWTDILFPYRAGADDFGYLLLADTLRHLRLANPPHAFPAFFQQIFVLQRPTYSSMFNLGQGLLLAFGWIFFGHPWAGVLLATGVLCASTYWMLRGWITSEWALAGGALCVMLFGPLCYWTNCYWGGALTACAGSLVFGAVPRFNRNPQPRYAALLGCGLALHLLTRPFEAAVLFVAAAFLLRWRTRHLAWTALPVIAAFGLIAVQNKQVTGKWTTLPYQLYRYDYGIPATFTFQRNPIPHATLNEEQQADYQVETAVHGYAPETVWSYCERLAERVRFLRFFLFAPLYVAAFTGVWKAPRMAAVLMLFVLASNFYPYFYPHYIAASASLFLLLAVFGLQRFRRAAPILLLLCATQFGFWYSAFAFGNPRTPTWNFLNGPDPQGRTSIHKQLARLPGKHLVFVHYSPGHKFSEWVHNGADIDASRTIFVHDIGPLENKELIAAYRDRDVWLLEPDFDPVVLKPYHMEQGPFQDVQ